MTSSRPYLIRAIFEWIMENNKTPYVTINTKVSGVLVPEKNINPDGTIVLNVSPEATSKLIVSNEALEFDARFSGVVKHIYAPIKSVQAIYAQETGTGMVFQDEEDDGGQGPEEKHPSKPKRGKPNLKIVK